jgi:hypothetical protein
MSQFGRKKCGKKKVRLFLSIINSKYFYLVAPVVKMAKTMEILHPREAPSLNKYLISKLQNLWNELSQEMKTMYFNKNSDSFITNQLKLLFTLQLLGSELEEDELERLVAVIAKKSMESRHFLCASKSDRYLIKI